MTAMPTILQNDFDLSSHNGTTAGLKLGGTLVTATAAELNIMDGVTATAAELNYNDIATLGTGAASKAVVLNASSNYTSPGAGTITMSSGSTFNVAGTFQVGGVAVTSTAAELNLNDLSAVGALTKISKVALTAGTHGTGSEVNTSLVLPAKCVVIDVWVDVTTAEVTGATKTIDVGTNVSGSDDPDGFLVGVSVATTGVKKGATTYTVGLNEEYAASTTRGVLIEKFRAGSDLALDVGIARPIHDITSGGSTVSITSGSAFTEFAGNLYVMYAEIA